MKEPTIEAQTLDDLGDVTVTVMVKRPDGKRVAVKLKALSEEEIWNIRRSLKRPRPPVADFRKQAGNVSPVYDYDNEDYRRALEEWDRQLTAKMLLASLTFYVPGETEEERIAELTRKLGQYAYSRLMKAVTKINVVSDEEIADISATFQPAGYVSASGNGAAGDTAEAVAET